MATTSWISHFDDAPEWEVQRGHLAGTWTMLGEAAGSRNLGVRRIRVPAGKWSTPVHDHGVEEEHFFVLGGSGVLWLDNEACAVRAGHCIVHRAGAGGHTLHAVEDLDVLAFGMRARAEAPRFPRLGAILVGRGIVAAEPATYEGIPLQFVREAELGAPSLPAEMTALANVVHLDDVTPTEAATAGQIARTTRELGRAAGARSCSLAHVEVPPGRFASALHCHLADEELYVVLEGDGEVRLGESTTPIRPGHVISRPPGTGISHRIESGSAGLVYLLSRLDNPHEITYYPDSAQLHIRALNASIEVSAAGADGCAAD